jgi:hypothetical protein
MVRTKVVGVGLSVFMCAALLSSPASAQAPTSSGIAGTVRDTSGGVLPGASITARHDATGIVVARVTGSRFEKRLAPGLERRGPSTPSRVVVGFRAAAARWRSVTPHRSSARQARKWVRATHAHHRHSLRRARCTSGG